MKNRLNPFFGTLVVIAMTQSAHAASATWNGTSDATWAGANWSASPAPGTGETATFDNAGGAVDVIDLTPNVTVGNIAFDNALVAAYTIGSGAVASQTLTLNNSGAITASDTINANQLVNAKLVLGTDAAGGSYTITNNDLSNTLTFAGGISGGTTGSAGAKTLTVSTAPLSAGGINLSGAITNGDASSLALAFTAVSGNVQMNLGNAGNTYSGGTSVASGVRLNVNAGAGAGLGSGDVTVDSGGQIFLNSAGTYTKNFSISGTAWTGDSPALGAIRIGAAGTILNSNVVLNTNSSIGVDSGRSGKITGNVTGAFNLDKTSSAVGTGSPLTLTGVNDYATTTITRGVISFAKQAALYNSTTSKWTKDYLDVASGAGLALGVGDSASGYWDAAAVTTFLGASQMGLSTTTDGFKSGSLIGFDTTNATAGTFTYGAIGNIGTSTLNGVVKLGTGTLVLDAVNTYTGATNVDAGTLNLASTGSISGTTVTISGGILSLAGTIGGTTLTINSGSFSNVGGTATFTTVTPAGGTFAQSSGTTTVPSVTTSGSADFGFINITGGNFTVSTSINLGRSFNSTTVPSFATPLAAPTTSGLYVNGATAAVSAATLNVGTANSSSSTRVNAGSLTVSGAVTIGKTTSTARYDVLQVSGGTFTAADTTNGIILSPNNGANINNAELYLSGGVTTAGRIAFGASTDTVGGNGLVIVDGGTLYVGASGIVKASTIGAYNTTVGLKSGTLGAAANWSSTLNVTLGTNPTIKAADAADVARDITLSGVLSGTGLTKTGAGTLELSGANTYTGTTTVSGGILTLSGSRLGSSASGGITVSNVAATNATLNISNGTYALGTNTITVGAAVTTAATGTVNQSGGSVTFTGASNGIILGNNNGIGNTGIYNLSGGSITTASTTTARGIILGTNDNGIGEFNLSGTGTLNMTTATGGTASSILEVGRYDSPAKDTTATFNQTGGTANVAILSIGGSGTNGTGISSTVNWTGGVFVAETFPRFAAGNTNTAVINIGGTADVTLPAFPTARGTSATASITFDGGTLRPGTTSTNYLGNISSAIINGGGAKIDVASAKDITIAQPLLAGAGSGGLTKEGLGSLTLTVPNSYTGNTTVSAGILSLGDGTTNTGLADGAEVVIDASVVLNLNFLAANSDTVNKLTIGGVQKAAGVWGASGSGAQFEDSHITGTGTLTVTTGPAGGYASWIDTPAFGLTAGQKGISADPDFDGIANLLEFVLNGNPSTSDSAILPDLVVTATHFEFTFTRRDDSLSPETIQTFQYGTDLTNWTNIVVPAGNAIVGAATITVTDGTPADTVKVSIPKSTVAPSTKLFGRLQVVK